MKLDIIGRAFIQSREGLRQEAYLDVAGVPTIGYGTTRYPSGVKVKIGDVCTKQMADDWFSHDVEKFEQGVMFHLLPGWVTQNQFNALVSLTYNIGVAAFGTSTLRKVVLSPNKDNRELIAPAFLAWNKVRINGKLVPSAGLTNRRKKEVELYFS